MGICEDVAPGTCDAVFIFFLVESSLAGIILLCGFLGIFCTLCVLGVKEATNADEEIANSERLREASRAMGERLDKLKQRTAQSDATSESHYTFLQPQLSSYFAVPRQNEQMNCTQPMYPIETNKLPFIDYRQL